MVHSAPGVASNGVDCPARGAAAVTGFGNRSAATTRKRSLCGSSTTRKAAATVSWPSSQTERLRRQRGQAPAQHRQASPNARRRPGSRRRPQKPLDQQVVEAHQAQRPGSSGQSFSNCSSCAVVSVDHLLPVNIFTGRGRPSPSRAGRNRARTRPECQPSPAPPIDLHAVTCAGPANPCRACARASFGWTRMTSQLSFDVWWISRALSACCSTGLEHGQFSGWRDVLAASDLTNATLSTTCHT